MSRQQTAEGAMHKFVHSAFHDNRSRHRTLSNQLGARSRRCFWQLRHKEKNYISRISGKVDSLLHARSTL